MIFDNNNCTEVIAKINFIYHAKNSIINLNQYERGYNIVCLGRNETFKFNGYSERDKFLSNSIFENLKEIDNNITEKDEDDVFCIVKENILIIDISSIITKGHEDEVDLFYDISYHCLYRDFMKIEKKLNSGKQGIQCYSEIGLFNIHYSEDYFGEGDSHVEFKGYIKSFNQNSILYEESIENREIEAKNITDW